MNFRQTRRGVLKGAALVGAALAVPQTLIKAVFAAPQTYQQFGGFVILKSADEPLPSGLVLTGEFPVLEGVDGNARIARFPSLAEAKGASGIPMYRLSPESEGWRPEPGVDLVRNRRGQLAALTVAYETYEASLGAWVRTVDLTASQVFLRPFPVWPTLIDNRAYPPAQVKGLPAPALMSTTSLGHVIRWVEGDVLFQLRVENGSSASSALLLAGSLQAA